MLTIKQLMFSSISYRSQSTSIDGFIMQVYLSLYTTVASMVNQITTGDVVSGDSLSISGFKVMFTFHLYNCSFLLSNNLSISCFLRSCCLFTIGVYL